jgi:hypothetical protein
MNEATRMFAESLKATGISMEKSAAEVAAYVEARKKHLLAVAAEPNPEEAVQHELANVVAFAGLQAVDQADAVDARARGLLMGFLLGMAS